MGEKENKNEKKDKKEGGMEMVMLMLTGFYVFVHPNLASPLTLEAVVDPLVGTIR